MPTYTFLNTKTNLQETHIMSISELADYKKANPDMKQLIISAPALADPVRVGVGAKPSNQFRDVLKEIKKKNWGSSINTF